MISTQYAPSSSHVDTASAVADSWRLSVGFPVHALDPFKIEVHCSITNGILDGVMCMDPPVQQSEVELSVNYVQISGCRGCVYLMSV